MRDTIKEMRAKHHASNLEEMRDAWFIEALMAGALNPMEETLLQCLCFEAAKRLRRGEDFQRRIAAWMQECFGPEISADKEERNHRFLEEALELVQATGCTKGEALQLVDYVYGRPQGDINQEVGGVMVTLAAHCQANGISMHDAAYKELFRITQIAVMEKIRAKQAAKPRFSPLPVECKS